MKVFLDYTQEELDAQYEHRNIVPNADEFSAKSKAESGRVRAAANGRFDVAYGDHPDELLDIFISDAQNAPVVVFFHGGRWRVGSKASNCDSAETFNAAGAHFVSVNFTLLPNTTMDGLIGQCRDAIAWVFRNAEGFGADPNRIYAMGKSAGGHIAGMMVTTDWQATHGLPANLIKGGLLVSGMYDLEPVRLSFRNEWLHLTEESAARNSPIRHIPDNACPIVVGYGALESDEFKRQSREFAEAWRAAGHEVTLAELDGHHHFSINAEMNNRRSPLIVPYLAMIGIG